MRCPAAFVASILLVPPGLAIPQELPPPEPVQFAVQAPDLIQEGLRVGEDFAYSFCLGRHVVMPRSGNVVDPYLDPALGPCGSAQNPSPLVQGGNPPYHFQLDSGWGFPPLGTILDLNGVLRGKPVSDRASTFRVCAVDMSGTSKCQLMTLQPSAVAPPLQQTQQSPPTTQRAPAAKKGGGGAGLLIAGLAAGGAAIAVGAALQNSSTESGGCSSGQTDCGDGRCCNAGSGCCGVYNGSEKCCPTGYPHYCPGLDKCYQFLPTCDFTVCYGIVAGAPGLLAGKTAFPGGMMPGDPSAKSQPGLPPLMSCPAKPMSSASPRP